MRNLTLRPSGLFVNAPPPEVPGFAAGTTVHTWDHREAFLKEGIYLCPAYDKDPNLPVKRGKNKVTKSCEFISSGKPCRVCWERPDVRVSYQLHISIRPKPEQLRKGRLISDVIASQADMSPEFLYKQPKPKYREKEKSFLLEGGINLTSENVIAYPNELLGKYVYDSRLHPTLFSITGKMNALSLSTQGGHPSVTGGVCHMATEREIRKLQRTEFNEMKYPNLATRPKGVGLVCASCYATGNRYIYTMNIKQKASVRKWLEQGLARGEGFVGSSLAKAFKFMQTALRSGFEAIPGVTLGQVVRINPGFFRFFDSGDLGDHPADLFEEFLNFASQCPDTMFWLPTRTWVYRNVRKDLAKLYKEYAR